MEINHTEKKSLLRWCGWFIIGNMLLLWLMGLKYTTALTSGELIYVGLKGKIEIILYVVMTYLSHFALLACLPGFLLIPLILLSAPRRLIFATAIVLSTVLSSFICVDAFVYELYHFHLNGIMLNLVVEGLHEQLFGFSWYESLLIISLIAGLLLLECLLAYGLWVCIINKHKLVGLGKWLVLLLCSCFYFSYAIVVFSAPYEINRFFIDSARFLPFYHELLGALLPQRHGLVALERFQETKLVHLDKNSKKLHYPLTEKLSCHLAKNPKNLVIIMIDAWRFDMLNSTVTPNLMKFSKRAWMFDQHFSGGNATGPGVFSFFYGLPPTYWSAMEEQHKGPVLLHSLMQQHYQIGIFPSATLKLPAFNNTVFADLTKYRMVGEGDSPYLRDMSVTKGFREFLIKAKKSDKPFFSFLFYDASHTYCAYDGFAPFKPVIKDCDRFSLNATTKVEPFLNRYKNAVYFVDQQVQQVIAALEQNHLLEDTVVVVTGDHGEEFNDNHLNYWGHASNFTRYQIQTPLIVYWPGSTPHIFDYPTNHFDIVPTLMQKLFRCDVDPASYSIGKNLLDKNARPYLVVGSYIDFGVVESDRITTVFPVGHYEIDHKDGAPIRDAKLNLGVMRHVFHDLQRFYW